jgi:hypothetical protein
MLCHVLPLYEKEASTPALTADALAVYRGRSRRTTVMAGAALSPSLVTCNTLRVTLLVCRSTATSLVEHPILRPSA